MIRNIFHEDLFAIYEAKSTRDFLIGQSANGKIEIFDFYNEGLRRRNKMSFRGKWASVKIRFDLSPDLKYLCVGGEAG